MSRKSRYVLSGLAVAATLVVMLPAAISVGAPTKKVVPVFQVNRSAKGDRLAGDRLAGHRLVAPRSIVVKKKPPVLAPVPRQPQPIPARDEARKLLDGCEPMFSPVTMPAMAHLAGRCIG